VSTAGVEGGASEEGVAGDEGEAGAPSVPTEVVTGMDVVGGAGVVEATGGIVAVVVGSSSPAHAPATSPNSVTATATCDRRRVGIS
jgi:hypothetical protein